MDNMTQAWILLLAGFIVVFTVLILLILIVTLYSKIVTSVQKAGEKKKEKKKVIVKAEVIEPSPAPAVPEKDDDEIPGEIIAVIAAAVDAMYGETPHKIRSVRKSRSSRSAWAKAGVLENTRPF